MIRATAVTASAPLPAFPFRWDRAEDHLAGVWLEDLPLFPQGE